MNSILKDISKLPVKELPILSDKEAGDNYSKWSFVNVYSLKDLKDIYLVSQSINAKARTVKEIAQRFNEQKTIKEKWEDRKALEYLNALVKFELLDSEYISKGDYFKESQINDELKDVDFNVLRNVFFKYFRFRELSAWFVSPEMDSAFNLKHLSEEDFISKSSPLYFYSERNRFTDTFLTDLNNVEYKYIIESDTVMRFWGVYLKWGTSLKILDRFNLSKTGQKTPLKREVSVAYFIKPFYEFDLIDFIEGNFSSKHILIPELIYQIVRNYRFSVSDIKSFIILQIRNNNRLTYERTSEIFLIKGKTTIKNIEAATYLFPKINNSYVSHIIIRK